jgi:pyridoxal 5'-phosphate synthase pdxS subunit
LFVEHAIWAKLCGEFLKAAAMIRTKGEAGTGDVVHAVKHIRQIVQEMKILTVLSEHELFAKAKELQAPYELVKLVAKEGKLPVPNFSAGGIATPADAALVLQLGAEAVFVGSGIFMGQRISCIHSGTNHPYDDTCAFAPPEEAERRARAVVRATTHYENPEALLSVSENVSSSMKGLAVSAIEEAQMLQTRGW